MSSALPLPLGPQLGAWIDYEWMVIVGALACFWSGWTIGASHAP